MEKRWIDVFRGYCATKKLRVGQPMERKPGECAWTLKGAPHAQRSSAETSTGSSTTKYSRYISTSYDSTATNTLPKMIFKTPPNECRELVLYEPLSIPRSPVYRAPAFRSNLLNEALYKASSSAQFARFIKMDVLFHERNRMRQHTDLQKGERYTDTDYLLLPALPTAQPAPLAISYDLSCQLKCSCASWPQQEGTFAYFAGSGHTDGEAVERAWAEVNIGKLGLGKEMAPGKRQNLYDDNAVLRAKL
ncbi:hypothetical protein C8R43DRAFT_940757 [Mycena crocata]|nr:hypothetical protein C8R43DRAFT_940757 [Mycena crocata]